MIISGTVREAYEHGKNTLSLAGLESPAFDALCLFEMAFGIGDRAGLAIHGGEAADRACTELFNELIIRRTREPLQYIPCCADTVGRKMEIRLQKGRRGR